MNEKTKRNGLNWRELLLQIPLFIFALLALFPFIWMILSSFKTTQEIVHIPPTFFPEKFALRGYIEIIDKLPITRNFLNSLIISSAATLIAMFVASLAGFVIAKYEFRGKNFFFYALLSQMMIPIAVMIIPLYVLFTQLKLQDTYIALILPFAISGFGVFLMRQFMAGIPDEMLEAARIDGATDWTIYRKIALPQVSSPLSGVAVFTFLTLWNQFYWPLVIVSKPEMRTLTQAVAMNAVQIGQRYDVLVAGATISVIPIIIVFVIAMRQVVESVTFFGGK